MKHRLLIWIFVLTTGMVFSNPGVAAAEGDSLAWRRFDGEKIEKFRKDRAFVYEKKEEKTDASKKVGWFMEWLRRLLDFSPGTNTVNSISNLVLIILIISAAAALVFALTKANFRGFLSGRGTVFRQDYEIIEEDIHEIPFEKEIAQAVNEGNFRKAVRLQYLRSLKHLSDRGLIEWQPNKTNRDYAYELAGSGLHERFEDITTWFDYVWYGEFEVNETLYRTCAGAYDDFNASIKKTSPVYS